jgi:3-methyladenine DNA glycosylase AlkD
MNLTETMQQLEVMGTAQNRKIYRRHGVGENQYGVSTANLKLLQKQIRINHTLAQSLWNTGNHDARLLATMVADPAQVEDHLLEAWAQDLDNYVIADAFAGLVSRTPLARPKMEAWTHAESEWIGQAGWNLLAHLALKDTALPDDYFRSYLNLIEQNIHRRKNRVRYSMNSALIAIGLRNTTLQEEALALARKIGPVEVDHGETNCQTPDAVAYIHKAAARRRK